MRSVEGSIDALYLSMQDGVRAVGIDGTPGRYAPLEGAGALCAGENRLLCADASGVVWKMDAQTLLPQGMFFAGPGVCDLALSKGGMRLYALLGEADSVVLLDGQNGRPLLLNRCGCNPVQMVLRKNLLAVAGGQSGCVHLYDAKTLVCRQEISMPGPVCALALAAGALYALCLTAQLDTLLVIQSEGKKWSVRLDGMPGALLLRENQLYVQTQGWLHVFDPLSLALLQRRSAPGRASKLCVFGNCLAMLDALSERAYVLYDGAVWRVLGEGIKDMCLALG